MSSTGKKAPTTGPLQLAVMGYLWRTPGAASAHGLYKHIRSTYKPIALTTLSSTLGRLVKAGWVRKLRFGRYEAAITRDDLIDLVAKPIREA